jgi:hypothetical protein
LCALIAVDLAVAIALSAAGILSEVPYHVLVIALSYRYLTNSTWRAQQLLNWLAARGTKPKTMEVGT